MKHSKTTLMTVGAISLLAISLAQAKDYGDGLSNFSEAIALDNAQGRHDHWRAVGRMSIEQGEQKQNCTASLIDSRDDSADASGPAYILTSGHCVTRNALNFSYSVPVSGHIDFDYFVGGVANVQRIPLKQIVQATMRGKDLALIELDDSLQSLLDKGIEPLAFADEAPKAGTDLMIVGAPSGHEDAPGLRLSLCPFEGAHDLVESIYTARTAQKHRCKGVAPGSSGGPVLARESNRIMGVLSTSTGGGKEENRCQINAPCEIQDGQPAWSSESNYSSAAIGVQACFSEGRFDTSNAECVLKPALEVTLGTAYVPNPFGRIKHDEQGNIVLPTWSWQFSLDTPFYRYKTTRSASECESPHHYSDALEAKDALINESVGPDAGMHFLCIIGVDSTTQRPAIEVMNKPVVVAMELAAAGPTRMPELKIERSDDGGYTVEPHYSNPQLWVYSFKSGPPGEVQCDDKKGYKPEFGGVKTFSASQLPLQLCSKSYDMSKQASLPRTDLLMP